MATKASIEQTKNGIEEKLKAMVSKANNIRGFLDRVIYSEYQKAQAARWQSQGSSETTRWPDLNEKYRAQKLKRFASYPGAGRVVMVATGKLSTSVIGPGEGHRKLVSDKSIIVSTTLSYAQYPDKTRTFTHWSDGTMAHMNQLVRDYLTGRAS